MTVRIVTTTRTTMRPTRMRRRRDECLSLPGLFGETNLHGVIVRRLRPMGLDE